MANRILVAGGTGGAGGVPGQNNGSGSQAGFGGTSQVLELGVVVHQQGTSESAGAGSVDLRFDEA
jgi:hypothetical protein